MQPKEFYEQENLSPITYKYSNVVEVFSCISPIQKIQVLAHPFFIKILVLDGVVQLTEKDEFFYHEMLTHVPLMAHPQPERILILGGGDGGTLREVLKYDTVKTVTIVEIDPEVVSTAKRFFPNIAKGFNDPRTCVVHMDGCEYIEGLKNEFDVIIIDGPDPVGPAQNLLAPQTLSFAKTALRQNGIFAAQTESLHFHREHIIKTQKSLIELFKFVDLYTQAISTYPGSWWSFSIASMMINPRAVRRCLEIPTRYYSSEVHNSSFFPPKSLKKLLNGELDW
ncbi:polyamine aminopropyltransferase [SAR202 cluster bacterium AD-802-E10_MRT_200m]|nr:polyamine aminopropyltransferase [SAR202 cluster bacterium AD-802-E10_MRT_200m]